MTLFSLEVDVFQGFVIVEERCITCCVKLHPSVLPYPVLVLSVEMITTDIQYDH